MAYISFKPTDYFNTILYTGNSGASQAQTGVGFSADWTWIKCRNSSEENVLTDTVRGATYWIRSNATNASAALATGLLSWQSDGFTVGNNGVVGTANNYVAWNWKAGTTTGISGGTITPSAYSFNTTSGCSILKWTGTGSAATIPHGLGAAPGLIFCKSATSTDNWAVYHKSITASKFLTLDTNEAQQSVTTAWNAIEPTSSVFSVGTSGRTNGSGNDYIAYAFAEKTGFSSFGKYQGTASAADGPFIYTGFKPAFLIIKRTDGTNDWMSYDNKRLGYNVDNNALNPNLADAAGSTDYLDILSNGIRIRTTDSLVNANGGNYVYMAWAAEPIVGSNATPGVAR